MIPLVICVTALVGCSQSRYLSLAPDEVDNPPCADLAPVLVEDLGLDRAECDLSGADLIFTDGTVMKMDPHASIGSTSSTNSPFEYSFANVGDFGIVAARVTAGCGERLVWGPVDAQIRVTEAFGDLWPCDE